MKQRYFWIDNPENPILWGLARQLDNSEKELLTLRFKEVFTNEEHMMLKLWNTLDSKNRHLIVEIMKLHLFQETM